MLINNLLLDHVGLPHVLVPVVDLFNFVEGIILRLSYYWHLEHSFMAKSCWWPPSSVVSISWKWWYNTIFISIFISHPHSYPYPYPHLYPQTQSLDNFLHMYVHPNNFVNILKNMILTLRSQAAQTER